MKKYLLSLTLSLLFIPIVLWGQNTSAKSLSSRLDTLIKYQLPAGSNVGISVYDLTTGKSLYTYQSDKLSRPASTMKLLTTITALARPDADVLCNGEKVGIVTSGGPAPAVGGNYAMALVSADADENGTWAVSVRGRVIDCEFAPMPFYKRK